MKRSSEGFEMIHLNDFAHLFGYSNWFDENMWKQNGAFMQEFREGDWIERDLAHFYITSKGLGTFLRIPPTPEFLPSKCCETGSKEICQSKSMKYKLVKSITRLSKFQNPVPWISIWHDIFIQLDNCNLKNDSEFRYRLFELTQEEAIEKSENSEGGKMYAISKVPKKRGPGRPRKYL
jgi:hypothetical protein